MFDEVHKALTLNCRKSAWRHKAASAMLFNMIRVCAGGLIALKLELKQTSNIDLDCDDQITELGDLIIRVFFPGEQPRLD